MAPRQEPLQVFLSSSMDDKRPDGPEFVQERTTLRRAFEKDHRLHNFCLYAIEDHAYPGRPREYYLPEVTKSWAIVVLIGVDYRKAVDDELQEAFDHGVKPFVYLKPAETRAEETEEFIKSLSDRVTWASYAGPEDLAQRVERDLNGELIRAQEEYARVKQELDRLKSQMTGLGEGPSEDEVEQAVRRYAAAALQQGDLGAAIANLQWLGTVGRNPADAHYLMARTYERVGFWQEASSHYQEVLNRIPHNLDALKGKCRVSNRLERFDEAKIAADAALALLGGADQGAGSAEAHILLGKYEAVLGLSRDLNGQDAREVRGRLIGLARGSGDDDLQRYVDSHLPRITAMMDRPRVELGFVISDALTSIITVPGDQYDYPIRVGATFLPAETSNEAALRFAFFRPIVLSRTSTAISFPEAGLVRTRHGPSDDHYFVECELDISMKRAFEFGFEINAAKIAPGEYQVQAHVTMADNRELLWVLLLRVSDSYRRLLTCTTLPPEDELDDL